VLTATSVHDSTCTILRARTTHFRPHPDVPPEVLRREQELKEAKPEVNPWACLILLIVTVALMAVTAVFVRQPTPFPFFHANVLTVFPPRSSSTA
jgi:hypothetical protein